MEPRFVDNHYCCIQLPWKHACLQSRYLATALVYLFIPRSLPSNESAYRNNLDILVACDFSSTRLGGTSNLFQCRTEYLLPLVFVVNAVFHGTLRSRTLLRIKPTVNFRSSKFIKIILKYSVPTAQKTHWVSIRNIKVKFHHPLLSARPRKLMEERSYSSKHSFFCSQPVALSV
jgi:hypothetical protein